MPSPLGHALGGIATGWLVCGVAGDASPRPQPLWRNPAVRSQVLLFATLGMLPDIDLLFGIHSTYTHSVGAALIVGLAALALAGTRGARLALACALAYASHALLDWLGTDRRAPIGIMALWPFTDRFYQAELHWFMAVRREYWMTDFWSQNIAAVTREIAILGTAVALVGWLRRPRRRTHA
ncbi:MAG TPA: metal-dependent hydrolase [Vicinamibacterales bacterium]